MTIPASFLSAVLPQALPGVHRTARNLAQQATQAFGEWFQALPGTGNGHSEPTSGGPTSGGPTSGEPTVPGVSPAGPSASPNGRSGRADLQGKLVQWLRSFASQMGLGDRLPEVTIVADGVGIPQIEGPQTLTDSLRESLMGQPELIDAINQTAREDLESDPLKWMPGHEPLVRMPIPSEPSLNN